jgi:hypothetical protein
MNNIKCPMCGSNTIIRTSLGGTNKGKKFYICEKYRDDGKGCQWKMIVDETNSSKRSFNHKMIFSGILLLIFGVLMIKFVSALTGGVLTIVPIGLFICGVFSILKGVRFFNIAIGGRVADKILFGILFLLVVSVPVGIIIAFVVLSK